MSAILPHAYGDHSLCDPAWCRSFTKQEQYAHAGLPGGRDLTDQSLRSDLETLSSKYTTKHMSQKLATVQSSNANESMNQLIASKAPKSHHFSESENLDYRAASTVSQKNGGHGYLMQVCKLTRKRKRNQYYTVCR